MYRTKFGRPLLGPWLKACPHLNIPNSSTRSHTPGEEIAPKIAAKISSEDGPLRRFSEMCEAHAPALT
jgi:hypothetical protein